MGGSFSILWPTKNSKYGDQVNRDFFADEKNESKKNFNFKINHDQATAGDMYFNFATKTRRKPFLEFFRIFQKIFLNSAKNELAIIFLRNS